VADRELDLDDCRAMEPSSKNGWRTQSTSTVYDNRPWLKIEKHKVLTPTGQKIDDWHVIELPSFVNVLARLEGGDFLLIRQNKYLCQPETLATVGGLIDGGESPREAAERELLEEAGCTSDSWHDLGEYVIDPNRGCGRCYLFLADHCRQIGPPQSRDSEQLDEIVVTVEELLQIALSGRMKAITWATCILKALLWLQREGFEK
jgi:8-oxo-dGTP pyrophosphatase MutT (NUDIX family)